MLPIRTQPLVACCLSAALLAACGRDAPRGPVHTAAVEAATPAAMVQARPLANAAPTDTLRLVQTFGDSLEFAHITGVYPLRDRLLVTDALMNYQLAVVRPADGAVTAHFGRRGQGPGEFGSITSVTPVGRGGDEVWIYDFEHRRFSRFRIRDASSPELRETVQSAVAASLLEPQLVDGQIVSNVLSHEYTLLISDPAGRSARRIAAEPPFGPEQMPNVAGRRLMNRTYMARDPRSGRLAILYQFTNRLEIFGPDGKRLLIASGPRATRTSTRVANNRFFWQPDNVMTYAGLAASSRFVYALYCGCVMRDNELPTRLHVFGWDGRFVREVAFDRPVSSLHVPEGDSIVYAAMSEPYPAVGRWVLR